MNNENLKKEVEQLIADVDKTHLYPMTRIYELSNKVFTKAEAPQSCASCLIRKVKELKKWLNNQNQAEQNV
ncbi:MAG: hypothetical protein E6767_02415 [Dysgonomonas sp.]|nr:hypothetical protein [Dysgonomonas sp.]